MNINYNLHKYIGYVLAPIRLILLILLYVIYILLLPLLKFIKQKYINEFTTYWNNTVIFILGLSIHIEGKENISNKTLETKTRLLMDFISWCDGDNSLLDIAEKCNVPVWELYPLVEDLKKFRLISYR